MNISITIEAELDDGAIAEMIENGYSKREILRKIKAEWSLIRMPEPIIDAEIVDIEYEVRK